MLNTIGGGLRGSRVVPYSLITITIPTTATIHTRQQITQAVLITGISIKNGGSGFNATTFILQVKMELKDKHFYKGAGRNFNIGLYKSISDSFTGLRHKWGDLILADEQRFTDKEGTFKPMELISGSWPVDMGNKLSYNALLTKLKILEGINVPLIDKVLMEIYLFQCEDHEAFRKNELTFAAIGHALTNNGNIFSEDWAADIFPWADNLRKNKTRAESLIAAIVLLFAELERETNGNKKPDRH